MQDQNPINPVAMMKTYVRKLMSFAFLPIVFGGILFLMGYFLNPEVLKVIWLLISGFIIFVGVMALVVINRMINRFKKANATIVEQNSVVVDEIDINNNK